MIRHQVGLKLESWQIIAMTQHAMHTAWAWPLTVVVSTDEAIKPILKGTRAVMKRFPRWARSFRTPLVSAMSIGKWPHKRKAQLCKDEITDRCQLCETEMVTLQHRHS